MVTVSFEESEQLALSQKAHAHIHVHKKIVLMESLSLLIKMPFSEQTDELQYFNLKEEKFTFSCFPCDQRWKT